MEATSPFFRMASPIISRRAEDRLHAHLLKKHDSPRLRALLTNFDICASLIFPGNKPRAVLVPPYVLGCYAKQTDAVYIPVEEMYNPAEEQRELIFHEFRHRIFNAGLAKPLTDFSRFRQFVSPASQEGIRLMVQLCYPLEKYEQEVDAFFTSVIALKAYETDGIFAARRILYASRPEDFYWSKFNIRMLNELTPPSRFAAPRTVLATAKIPHYLRPIAANSTFRFTLLSSIKNVKFRHDDRAL